ncbi:MAG: Stp1/IreP family PP2C-type Ser/Thr phosphatase [Deltaproteobacteria bacterium]|nr:Stp1/IreP family PP2C-type Ser/Thr phosphatase [Deltaproteobacteria bacterium]MBW2305317.1 Stp1/IreP family PP2C-type Ser/Thr phosphatase [Deltaproteobacteria bacterium]
MIFKHAVCTDIGLRRNHNEDAYAISEIVNLYVVADGMGGHAAGEVASEMAVRNVLQFIRESIQDEGMTWPFGMDLRMSTDANRILSALRLANQSIYHTAAGKAYLHGMGTTIVLAFFRLDQVYIAHVGDSRAYRFRNGEIRQITRDHSLLDDHVHRIIKSPDNSGDYPLKNIITRALGLKEEVQADIQSLVLKPGDRFLLCTDGLTDMLSQEEVSAIVQNSTCDLRVICQELVNQANARGGKDNITVILVDCI